MMRKQENNLVAIDDLGVELLRKIKRGDVIEVSVVRKRNYQFHKKLFSLLNYAFENWEHEEVFYKGALVEDNFDVFRENVLIMAGYGYPIVNLKGEVRYIAKSISFASMTQDVFDELYSAVINSILRNVLNNHSEQDLVYGVLAYG
ncbi:MAG: DUF1367 family protein [Methylomarinum sp.]|nr:DUF1367 family protein [Methylomarinum sp.]